MKNSITSTNHSKEDYKLYDEIISVTYANIFSLSKGSHIILKDYNHNNPCHRVFYEVSNMVAYVTNKLVFLQMPLFKYLSVKIKTKNKNIRRIWKNKDAEHGIDILKVARFEATAFEHGIYVFEDIFKAYYEGSK